MPHKIDYTTYIEFFFKLMQQIQKNNKKGIIILQVVIFISTCKGEKKAKCPKKFVNKNQVYTKISDQQIKVNVYFQ